MLALLLPLAALAVAATDGFVAMLENLPAAAAAAVVTWNRFRSGPAALSAAGLALLLLPGGVVAWVAAAWLVAVLVLDLGAPSFVLVLAAGGWFLGVAGEWLAAIGLAAQVALMPELRGHRDGLPVRSALALVSALVLAATALWFAPALGGLAVVVGLVAHGIGRHPQRHRVGAALARYARWAGVVPAGLLFLLAGLGRLPVDDPVGVLMWGWGAIGAGIWLLVWSFGWELEQAAGDAAGVLALVVPLAGAGLAIVMVAVGNLGQAWIFAALAWLAVVPTFPLGARRFLSVFAPLHRIWLSALLLVAGAVVVALRSVVAG